MTNPKQDNQTVSYTTSLCDEVIRKRSWQKTDRSERLG